MLTGRQIEIMNLVKLGYENKQIAVELGITINTVKTLLSEAFGRLGAVDRAHAVYLAMRQGIIS